MVRPKLRGCPFPLAKQGFAMEAPRTPHFCMTFYVSLLVLGNWKQAKNCSVSCGRNDIWFHPGLDPLSSTSFIFFSVEQEASTCFWLLHDGVRCLGSPFFTQTMIFMRPSDISLVCSSLLPISPLESEWSKRWKFSGVIWPTVTVPTEWFFFGQTEVEKVSTPSRPPSS